MALPTDFNTRTELSETLTVTRIKGGYLFSDKYGFSRSTQFLTDAEIVATIVPVSGLPTTFYERTALSETTFVTRIDGGYLYGDKQGGTVDSLFLSYDVINNGGSKYKDYHSGFNLIESGETITIETNKQMVNFNKLTMNGILIINGHLILR